MILLKEKYLKYKFLWFYLFIGKKYAWFKIDVKFKNKKNLTKIKCSKQDKILLNILSEEYGSVEIIYVDYTNLCNIECKKMVYLIVIITILKIYY